MGFGTVVASIVMFIAVLTISTSVFIIMKNDIADQSGAMREQSNALSNNIKTAISIVNLGYDNTTNTTVVSVRNTGATKLTLDLTDLFIDLDFVPRDTLNRTISIDSSTDSKNVGIWDPNEIVNVEIPKGLDTGDHTFKMTVQYGVYAEDIYSVYYG